MSIEEKRMIEPTQANNTITTESINFTMFNAAQVLIVIMVGVLMYRQFFQGYTVMGIAKPKSKGLPITKIMPKNAAELRLQSEARERAEKSQAEYTGRQIAEQVGGGVEFAHLDKNWYSGVYWFRAGGHEIAARDAEELRYKMKAVGLG